MLARKISRSKWSSKPFLRPEGVRADAVTGCLRTTDDTLSMWRLEGNGDVEQVFLALATGPQNIRFDTMDIVMVDEEKLVGAGLKPRPTEGATAVLSLQSRHVDIVELDLDKLGTLAKIIDNCIKNGMFERRSEKQVRQLVVRARNDGLLQLDKLKPELVKELSRVEIRL